MNESAILGTKLSVQVARCVTWRIARCYDPDALFKVCPCLPALIARLPSAPFGVFASTVAGAGNKGAPLFPGLFVDGDWQQRPAIAWHLMGR